MRLRLPNCCYEVCVMCYTLNICQRVMLECSAIMGSPHVDWQQPNATFTCAHTLSLRRHKSACAFAHRAHYPSAVASGWAACVSTPCSPNPPRSLCKTVMPRSEHGPACQPHCACISCNTYLHARASPCHMTYQPKGCAHNAIRLRAKTHVVEAWHGTLKRGRRLQGGTAPRET